MLFVNNENITGPRVNLAIEEHLLRNVDIAEPILLFYINEPSVIIGRNQNTIEEIDPSYVEAHEIHVVRRLSGGGAVYHDLGNLNFSFVTQGKDDLHNFARFIGPVVEVLRGLGVDAELSGKSDIFVDGKKISGNAQYSAGRRMFSHGTLLFDTNIEHMLKALNPRRVQIESKAVQSVRNFVTNIRELLPDDMDIHQLKQAILDGLFGAAAAPTYLLSSRDWEQIRQITAERYGNWDWNYGRSPAFNVRKSGRFPVGKVDVHIEVTRGRIQNVKIYGDFTGTRDVAELEARLLDVRYDPNALESALKEVDMAPFLGQLSKSDFLTLLY
ncbi:MAG: lipoate--protein ligase [Anaerolineae bacterium]